MKRLIAALCALAIVTLPFPRAQSGGNTVQEGFVLLLTVNTTDDHNDSSCDASDCTLREAMFAANDVSTNDIINFSVTGVINLVAPLPVISDGVMIEGPGANLLTVRRETGGNYPIFIVTTPETVSLSGLTVSNGRLGIFNQLGTLMISNSVISINSGGGISPGAGISNLRGTLTITNRTISDNVSNDVGGGIFNSLGT